MIKLYVYLAFSPTFRLRAWEFLRNVGTRLKEMCWGTYTDDETTGVFQELGTPLRAGQCVERPVCRFVVMTERGVLERAHRQIFD